MPRPLFRLVCPPSAFADAPDGWAAGLLEEGELALVPGDEGLAAVSEAAHTLATTAVLVLRSEETADAQETTVRIHADGLALVWVASQFSEASRRWAKERGPMTLLVESTGPLEAEDRARMTRFVSILGRQID